MFLLYCSMLRFWLRYEHQYLSLFPGAQARTVPITISSCSPDEAAGVVHSVSASDSCQHYWMMMTTHPYLAG